MVIFPSIPKTSNKSWPRGPHMLVIFWHPSSDFPGTQFWGILISILGKSEYFTNLNSNHLGMIPQILTQILTIIYGEVVVRPLYSTQIYLQRFDVKSWSSMTIGWFEDTQVGHISVSVYLKLGCPTFSTSQWIVIIFPGYFPYQIRCSMGIPYQTKPYSLG